MAWPPKSVLDYCGTLLNGHGMGMGEEDERHETSGWRRLQQLGPGHGPSIAAPVVRHTVPQSLGPLSLSLFLPCESNDVSLHLLAWSSQTFLALILHWLDGKSVNKWGKHWRRLVSNCEEFFGL